MMVAHEIFTLVKFATLLFLIFEFCVMAYYGAREKKGRPGYIVTAIFSLLAFIQILVGGTSIM